MRLFSWIGSHDCFECGELDKLVRNEQVKKKMLERMVRVGLCSCQEDPAPHPNTPYYAVATLDLRLIVFTTFDYIRNFLSNAKFKLCSLFQAVVCCLWGIFKIM